MRQASTISVVGGVLLLSAALAYGGGHIVDSRTIERSQAVSRAMGCNRTGFDPVFTVRHALS